MRRILALLLIASGILVACGAPLTTTPPTPSATPAATPLATRSATSSAIPPSSAAVTPGPAVGSTASTQNSASALSSSTALPTAGGGFQILSVAETVVDRLRVRSAPDVAATSIVREPLLPIGTALLILDGPVAAADYTWYEVAPLGTGPLPKGWVAAASRSGEPWIATATFGCPPAPADLASLRALPASVGLLCFAGRPITVQGRILECNCDVMFGGSHDPGWMFGFDRAMALILVSPEVVKAPSDTNSWFVLAIDPEGTYPDPLPIGEVVTVTGVFDHPAAAACTYTPGEGGGPTVHSTDCRLAFAVTRIEQ